MDKLCDRFPDIGLSVRLGHGVKKRDPVPLEQADLSIVFGLFDGIYRRGQEQIVIEDDLDVIRSWVATGEADRALADPNFTLMLPGSSELYHQLKGRTPKLFGQPDQQTFVSVMDTIHLSRRTYGELFEGFGAFYENFYSNLDHLPTSKRASDLFGRFSGVPAIICGAGPSLDAATPYLKQMAGRAVVMAPGSSMPKLLSNAVIPTYGVGIDPFFPQTGVVRTAGSLGIPYFYRLRWHAPALDMIEGDKLYVGGGSGYPICDWVDEKMGVTDHNIDEGLNCVHFAVEIAHKMRCSPIVLVGLDLSENGNTAWKWISEALWLSKWKKAPLLNATTEGIEIPGVKTCCLSDIAPGRLPDVVVRCVGGAVDLKGDIVKSLQAAKECMHQLAQVDCRGKQALYEVELAEQFAYAHLIKPHDGDMRLIDKHLEWIDAP